MHFARVAVAQNATCLDIISGLSAVRFQIELATVDIDKGGRRSYRRRRLLLFLGN